MWAPPLSRTGRVIFAKNVNKWAVWAGVGLRHISFSKSWLGGVGCYAWPKGQGPFGQEEGGICVRPPMTIMLFPLGDTCCFVVFSWACLLCLCLPSRRKGGGREKEQWGGGGRERQVLTLLAPRGRGQSTAHFMLTFALY